MNYWLIKSEPGTYSWDDLVRDQQTRWDGVRNFQARNNIRNMRAGDLALFYHSGEERSIPGVARVASAPYPDPTAKGEPWVVVDVKTVEALPKPVTLAAIKDEAKLKDMALVKYARLSVQPVTDVEWKLVCKMGGLK